MATFPLLSPSEAPITPGAWPVTATASLNGAESRIRHGSAQIGRRLRLTFTNITEASFLAILAHYRGQRSGFDSFGFDTTTLAADLTPAGHAWLYASPPQVVDEHANCFTVACEFRAEPRGLVAVSGKAWASAASVLSRNVVPGRTWASNASTFLPGTGARVIYGARWSTEWTRFTRDSVVQGVAWATSSTTLTPGRAVVVGSNSGGVGALLTFTGGTAFAWDMDGGEDAYGFVFTLASARTVAGFGFYNPNQVTFNNAYHFAVIKLTGDPFNQPNPIELGTLSPGSSQGTYPPDGDGNNGQAYFDGAWRRRDKSNGPTLEAGTWTFYAYTSASFIATPDTLIKNATGVITQSGITFVNNFAYVTGTDTVIAADGVAYFGPMLFFT
jgi:hypothetical protein